ncbi:MAG: TRAM domain-containing protein [Phycisphaerae bacterium]|jgi:uncharacterized protein YacL
MLLTILRVLFVLIVVGVAMNLVEASYETIDPVAVLVITLGVASIVVGLDVLVPQKSLLSISGLFFGLMVGLLIAYGASFIVELMADSFRRPIIDVLELESEKFDTMVMTVKLLIGVISCYMAVSFILQTKDDVRFVIPYVEFAKQRKGQHPLILDTSVIIDGRIADILQTWPVDVPVMIPRFVLHELQAIADSGDRLKRNRGRRGLDIVNRLQGLGKLDVQFHDPRMTREEGAEPVDQRLVTVAKQVDGRIVTNDYNLNKVAQIRGVEVININDLANALKPVFLPGEAMQVKIIKPGEEPGQGVGYLEDGTMVVVESARERIGETVPILVTSVLQTSAGRMVFGRVEGSVAADRSRRRP